jgi:tripartite-type tricarboxylate transporter receptor subunit TctC
MLRLPRRRFLHLTSAAIVVSLVPMLAPAQAYPARPVRLISPFPAGGPSDLVGRVMSQWLSEHLGQPFIVENRPGGGGNTGAETVAKAAADGYMLLLVSGAHAVNATLDSHVNLVRDVAPVAGLVRLPNVMVVHPSLPARTLPELIAYAKSNPGRINFASGGIGTTSHVMGEMFKMMTGVNMVHVPYRGTAPALNDLLAGQVQLYFSPIAQAIELIHGGRLHALAVTGGARSEALRAVPTIGELVPGYEASNWFGLGAPRQTPAEIIARLNETINAALDDSNIKAQFAKLDCTMLPGSPADFGNLIADEVNKWGRVVKFAGIRTG